MSTLSRDVRIIQWDNLRWYFPYKIVNQRGKEDKELMDFMIGVVTFKVVNATRKKYIYDYDWTREDSERTYG